MKKIFKTLAIIFVFIMAFSLVGCGTITLKGGPKKADPVTSNGSMAVRKGDYLYFVNGFISNADLKGQQNDYGNVKKGGIYRAKLVNGELMYDIETTDDEEEIKTLKNVELLVPKLAGFEFSGLYIYGNYIYFATPNTEKDEEGETRFDLTDFYCVKLNGGEIHRLANGVNIKNLADFAFTGIDNRVYLTYFADGNIYNLKIDGKEVESREKLAENVTSFAMLTNDSVQSVELSSDAKYVYYTRDFTENESSVTGNVMAKANLKTNEESVLRRDNNNTYSIKGVKNGSIYYTRVNESVTNAYVYSKSLDNFVESPEKQLTIVAYSSSMYVLDVMDGYAQGVIVNEKDKLLLLTGITNPETDINTLYEGAFTTLLIKGEYIYGTDADSNLIRINFQTGEQTTLLTSDTKIYSNYMDYDNGYLYYLVEYTNDNGTSYYMNRLYLNAEEYESEFIGVFNSKDKPEVEESKWII